MNLKTNKHEKIILMLFKKKVKSLFFHELFSSPRGRVASTPPSQMGEMIRLSSTSIASASISSNKEKMHYWFNNFRDLFSSYWCFSTKIITFPFTLCMITKHHVSVKIINVAPYHFGCYKSHTFANFMIWGISILHIIYTNASQWILDWLKLDSWWWALFKIDLLKFSQWQWNSVFLKKQFESWDNVVIWIYSWTVPKSFELY